jgi:hypothetical protein
MARSLSSSRSAVVCGSVGWYLAITVGCSSSGGGAATQPRIDASPLDDGAVASTSDATADAADAAVDAGSGILVPSNFDPTGVSFAGVGVVDVPGTATEPCALDTDQGTLTCANQTDPFPIVVTPITLSASGGHATLFAMTSFKLDAGTTLTVTGTKPAILYALGGINILGTIDVAAHGSTEGPGAYHDAGPGQGAPGASVSEADSGSYVEVQAAGGGSYCGMGGFGAPVGADGGDGARPGPTYGTASLVPLLGGSSGGSHSSTGYGGGAIQITSNVSITIAASGGINANGNGGDDHFAVGGGGGSGGAILLEAPAIRMAGTLTANGGGGGDQMDVGADGNFSVTPAPGGGLAGGPGSAGGVVNGQNGTTSQSTNFGGGGGGAGWIRINTFDGSTDAVTGVVSPSITSACATVAKATMQ